MTIEMVAASAVRIACVIVGRFCFSPAQNFISESSSLRVRLGKITISAAAVPYCNSNLADYMMAVNADAPAIIDAHFLYYPDKEINELGARD